MKKFLIYFAMMAVAAVNGFVLSSCGDDDAIEEVLNDKYRKVTVAELESVPSYYVYTDQNTKYSVMFRGGKMYYEQTNYKNNTWVSDSDYTVYKYTLDGAKLTLVPEENSDGKTSYKGYVVVMKDDESLVIAKELDGLKEWGSFPTKLGHSYKKDNVEIYY